MTLGMAGRFYALEQIIPDLYSVAFFHKVEGQITL